MKTPAALACALLCLTAPAYAALGGDVTSVEADRAHINASLRVAGNAGYNVHEMQTPSGTTIREFVTPDQKVFAVAWEGPNMPDLRQLLGSYFEQFEAIARRAHAQRRPVSNKDDSLVIHSGGHMRAFAGTAYVPAMLPQGFNLEDLH